MGSWVRSCLQSALKMVNSVIGLVGMGMIMYSMWMFRSWYKHFDGFPSSFDSSPPWFIYTFLGLGIFHCLITCAGLIAAETVNIHCLSCYMSFVFLLIVSESAITADIYLNKNWEEDFPEDPTGKFDEFNRFVRSNQEMCKWIGLLIVAAQWELRSPSKESAKAINSLRRHRANYKFVLESAAHQEGVSSRGIGELGIEVTEKLELEKGISFWMQTSLCLE